MLRREFCVICGNPLPPGGRVDRRYCREACRVQAYRERHKHEVIDRAPTPNNRADGVPSESPGTAVPSSEGTQLAAELTIAREQIKDLEAQSRALRQRTLSLEQQHETVQRRLMALEATIQQFRTAGTQTIQESNPPAGSAQKPDAPPEPPSSPLLPWMLPATEEMTKPTPKWTLLPADILTSLDARTDNLLAQLPDAMRTLGLRTEALRLQFWQKTESRPIRWVARALTRRFICTEKSERTTEAQRGKLLELALVDLTNPHPSEEMGDRAALAAMLANANDRKALASVAALLLQQVLSA